MDKDMTMDAFARLVESITEEVKGLREDLRLAREGSERKDGVIASLTAIVEECKRVISELKAENEACGKGSRASSPAGTTT